MIWVISSGWTPNALVRVGLPLSLLTHARCGTYQSAPSVGGIRFGDHYAGGAELGDRC
jgi:hypothetical protein